MRALLVLVLLVLLPIPAWGGEEDEEKNEYITVVTARRHDKAGVSVQKIKRAEIQSSGAHSAAELLEGEAAIHAITGSRGERIFSMRGFSQRQVVVLVDGAPAYIPYDGQVDLNNFAAELVDRVTIIKGPGSVLYGPNGPGGAVNIVTRRPGSGPAAQVLAETGRSGHLRLRGYHALQVNDRVAYTVHGGYSQQEDFALSSSFTPKPGENGGSRDNSDRWSYNLGARVWAAPAQDHELEAGVTFVDSARGVPGSTAYSTPRYHRFTSWRTLNATLAHRGKYLDALEIDEQLFVSLFDNLLDAYDDNTFTTQDSPMAFHSWYHDQIIGGRVRAQYRFDETPWGPTSIRLWASVQHDRHQRDDEDGTPPLESARTIATVAPEVEATFLELLTLVLALQVDVEEPTGEAEGMTGLGPLISLRLDPTDDLLVQASAARRTRFPTLRERYSSAGGYRLPNPDLQPEVAWNFGLEAGWRAARWLTLQVAFFESEVDDLIERVHLGNGVERMENIGSARFMGGELALRLTPLRWLQLRAGYTLLHARRTDEGRDTDLLENRPMHKATFKVRAAPWRWVELTTRLGLVGPQDFEHPETGAWGKLGTYARWDARLNFKPLPWLDLYVNVKNILDANYQTKFGYPDPGRQVFVGMKVTYERDGAVSW